MALVPHTHTGRLQTTMHTMRIKIQKAGIPSLATVPGRTVVVHTLVFGIRLLAQPESGLPASANLLERSSLSLSHTRHRLLLRVGPAHLENIPHRIILVKLHPPR